MNWRQVVGLDDYTDEELVAAVEEARKEARRGEVVSVEEAYAEFTQKRRQGEKIQSKAYQAR